MNGLNPLGGIKASTALILCLGTLLLGTAAGYGLNGRERVDIQTPAQMEQGAAAQPDNGGESTNQPDTGEAAQVAQMGTVTVSPQAKVRWECHMACGHTVELEDAQPIVGKTREEIETAYGPAAIIDFSADSVSLRLELTQYCPEHYLLKLENGVLTVRKTDSQLQEQVLLTLDVELPADAAGECAEGLPFDSLEDINVYLEGIEG